MSATAAGERYGNKLFLPILIVLVTAVAGTLLYLYTPLHETGAVRDATARPSSCSASACCSRLP